MIDNTHEESDKQGQQERRCWFYCPFNLGGLAIVNVLAFYSYLFWDSILSSGPALIGSRVDPLFLRGDRFMDWINTLHSAALLTPYGLESQVAMPVYGPLTYVLLAPLARSFGGIVGHPVLARILWLGITAVIVTCVALNLHRTRRLIDPGARDKYDHLLLAILLSYPFLFAFDRGNLELITFCFVSWYVARTIRSQVKGGSQGSINGLVSNLILAFAVSIKPYTLLFVALLLVDGQHSRVDQLKQCAIAIIQVVLMTLALSLASLLTLYRGNLLRGASEFMFWQQQFRLSYIIGGSGDRFFCSPYVLLKKLIINAGVSSQLMSAYYRIYPVVGLVIVVCVFVVAWRYVRLYSVPSIMLNAISFGLLVIPYNANEYKAIYFLIPFSLGFSVAKSAIRHVSSSGQGIFGRLGVTPITVSAGLAFFMLINRYGLIGDNLLASLFTSLLLIAFPFLFISSFMRMTPLGLGW